MSVNKTNFIKSDVRNSFSNDLFYFERKLNHFFYNKESYLVSSFESFELFEVTIELFNAFKSSPFKKKMRYLI
jgi:hypothetical protein